MKTLLLISLFTFAADSLPFQDVSSSWNPPQILKSILRKFLPVQDNCQIPAHVAHIDRNLDVLINTPNWGKGYLPSHFSWILFLSDGDNPKGSLAEHVAKTHSQLKIVKTDISLNQIQSQNLWCQNLDNSSFPYPYKDNSFEIIIMKKGLCLCYNDYTTCGGVDVDDAGQFFTEVGRILDKNSKNSFAYIHGENQTQRSVSIWVQGLEIMRAQFPILDFAIHKDRGYTRGFIILSSLRIEKF